MWIKNAAPSWCRDTVLWFLPFHSSCQGLTSMLSTIRNLLQIGIINAMEYLTVDKFCGCPLSKSVSLGGWHLYWEDSCVVIVHYLFTDSLQSMPANQYRVIWFKTLTVVNSALENDHVHTTSVYYLAIPLETFSARGFGLVAEHQCKMCLVLHSLEGSRFATSIAIPSHITAFLQSWRFIGEFEEVRRGMILWWVSVNITEVPLFLHQYLVEPSWHVDRI